MRQVIRLPIVRGRNDLRGPFGKLLNAQMSKNRERFAAADETMSFIHGFSTAAAAAAAAGSADNFHQALRQVNSDISQQWIKTQQRQLQEEMPFTGKK